MKLLAYVRWSPRPVVRWSEQIQRDQIEEWASRKGHEVLGWYTDRAVSGSERHRAARDEMLAQAKQLGAEGFVSADLSRWTREDALAAFALLSELRDAGMKVYWVAEDWLDLDAPYALVALVALIESNNEERKRTARKTRDGVLKARRSGIWVGRIPWGWRRVREIRRDDGGEHRAGTNYWIEVEKSEEIRRLFELRALEQSWHSIERRTNVDAETVRSVLRNPVNRSVVGDELWEQVQRTEVGVRSDSRGYLLSGLLMCPWCGNRLIGCARKPWGGGPDRTPTYRCSTWKAIRPHPWRSISEPKVWRHLAPVLEALTIGPQEQRRLIAESRTTDRDVARRNRERSRLALDIEHRRARIEKAVMAGVLRIETAAAELKELDIREAAVPPPLVEASQAVAGVANLQNMRALIDSLEWPRDGEGIRIANLLLRETIQRIEWPDRTVKYRPRIVLQPRYAALYAALGFPRVRPASGRGASLDGETLVAVGKPNEQA